MTLNTKIKKIYRINASNESVKTQQIKRNGFDAVNIIIQSPNSWLSDR